VNPCAANHDRYGASHSASGPDTLIAGLPIKHLPSQSRTTTRDSIGNRQDYQKPKKITTAEFADEIDVRAALLRITAYWR
jgi:hypothetical protein